MEKTPNSNQLEQQLKENAERRLSLWDRMESGDVDALIELSVSHGMMMEEDADFCNRLESEE
jgi:hypothetical protein